MTAVLNAIRLNIENSMYERSTAAPLNPSVVFNSSLTYLVVGVFLILANGPLFINILRHTVLRAKKEYLLLAGLAFADMLAGWASLAAGAYRLHLLSVSEIDHQATHWECIGTPHVVVMTYALIVQAGMLLLISGDRLVAVLKPLQYNTFTVKYSLKLLGICYVSSAIYATFLLIYIPLHDDGQGASTIDATCFNHSIFKSIAYVRLFLASSSIIVYVVVWILFRKYRESTLTNFPTQKGRLRKLQRRLSVTVGICAILTFIFYILPSIGRFINESLWNPYPLYWILNCCNAIVNVFVYSLRHEDIRRGLKLLFVCKELPSPAAQRLAQESHWSMSATARAAVLILRSIFNSALPNILPATAKFNPRRDTTSSTSTTISLY